MRILPLLILPMLANCQGDETLTAYGASGREWVLQEIDGVAFSATATLTFPEPGSLGGQAPCNSYTARLTAPYPWFETGSISSTKRACAESGQESTYFAALSAMTLSEVLGDTLVLSTPEGRSMVFKDSG